MAETPGATEGADRLVGFGRELRARGLPVGTGRILSFCRAAAVLAPLDRSRVYLAGKTTLVSRPEDFPAFDRAFDDYFRNRDFDDVMKKLFDFGSKSEAPPEPKDVTGSSWEAAGEAEPAEGEDVLHIVASSAEVLRTKSFDELTEVERAAVNQSIRRLRLNLPERSARRTRRSSTGGRFDLRGTVRRSFRTHGEPFERAWRDRHVRPRPLVLILDVSGSMSPYARALMQFGYAAATAGRKVEVFCFGTRSTRITRALRTKDPGRAIDEVAAAVHDWEGGTRIGESLRQILDRFGQSTALRSAIVVLCSDGLERGDPELLTAQLTRLARLTHKIVWVNPLAGDPRYLPLAKGMAAALPHIDKFLPGHNLASLEDLARVVQFL